jgi:hypothetical protein
MDWNHRLVITDNYRMQNKPEILPEPSRPALSYWCIQVTGPVLQRGQWSREHILRVIWSLSVMRVRPPEAWLVLLADTAHKLLLVGILPQCLEMHRLHHGKTYYMLPSAPILQMSRKCIASSKCIASVLLLGCSRPCEGEGEVLSCQCFL